MSTEKTRLHYGRNDKEGVSVEVREGLLFWTGSAAEKYKDTRILAAGPR